MLRSKRSQRNGGDFRPSLALKRKSKGLVGDRKSPPRVEMQADRGWWWVNKPPVLRFNAREGQGGRKSPHVEMQAKGVLLETHPTNLGMYL